MSEEKKALVPKLRFPEFQEGSEWAVGELDDGDIAALVSERRALADLSLLDYVSTENLLPDFGGVIATSNIPSSGSVTSFIEGDVLIANIRPYLKKAWQANKSGGASNDVIVFRAQGAVTERFLAFVIKNNAFINYVMRGAKGVKMPRGDISLIRKYPVAYPTNAEQQKIADCLSSLDELIAAHTDKLDALKTHKKGLLQQLFPREGETVPRLRFFKFNGYGYWKTDRLEDIANRGSGHTPNKKHPEYYDGGISWVSLSDSPNLDNGYIFETKKEISEAGLNNSSAVLHPEGTVILSRDAGVGKSAVLGTCMAVSQHFITWTCDDENLNNWFLYYILQIRKPVFESIAVGNTVKTIGLAYFKEMHLAVPTVLEQQKIANCLSSLDDRIAAQADKIEALKQHKKGLLQQLFPAMDEVGT